jgi:hypothetical protein
VVVQCRRWNGKQQGREAQHRTAGHDYGAGSVALQARAGEYMPKRFADRQRDAREETPDGNRHSNREILRGNEKRDRENYQNTI